MTNTELADRLAKENARLREVVCRADDLRDGIRRAGVKRDPNLYAYVMAFDAARALL